MKNLIHLFSVRNSQNILKVTFILIITSCFLKLKAQPILTFYSDIGKNTYSEALIIRSAFLGNYKLGNYNLRAAFQTNVIYDNNISFSGYRIEGSREFKFKNSLFELNGFGLWTAYSDVLNETNYGCILALKSRHFDLQFGTNFRTYSFRREALERLEIENDDTKIHENFNLMYSFGYYFKPINHRWNAGLSITNIDYFMINQETNPFVNLKGHIKISPQMRLFAGAWYKTAGALNMSSNYFGFLIRGGIVWNFN